MGRCESAHVFVTISLWKCGRNLRYSFGLGEDDVRTKLYSFGMCVGDLGIICLKLPVSIVWVALIL